MYKCILVFTVFLKNKNNIAKIKRSKVTDYAALNGGTIAARDCMLAWQGLVARKPVFRGCKQSRL